MSALGLQEKKGANRLDQIQLRATRMIGTQAGALGMAAEGPGLV